MLYMIPDAALIGNGFYIESRAQAEQMEIPLNIGAVSTGGYYEGGDGGEAIYKRIAVPEIGSFTSADGQEWGLSASTFNTKMFGAKGDLTTDDTAFVQNALDYCLETIRTKQLYVRGVSLITEPLIVDRAVGTSEDVFTIIGEGSLGGFITDAAIEIFDSSLAFVNAPVSEAITFENMWFASYSAALGSKVLSQKFLRISFSNCFFISIVAMNATATYVQTLRFEGCTLRDWQGNFVSGAGTYDVSFLNIISYRGVTLLRSVDAARGSVGTRFVASLCEVMSGPVFHITGFDGEISGNHFEALNSSPAFNFFAGGVLNGASSITGNYFAAMTSDAFYWGPGAYVASSGNTYDGHNLHTNVVQCYGFTSTSDLAVVSDYELASVVGSVQSKGPVLNKPQTIVYSADITPDGNDGNRYVLTVTNGVAYAFRDFTNPVVGQQYRLTVRNASGGAAGVMTFNPGYKLAAWTQPANGFSRSITFEFNGVNFVEISRTTVDVPN